MFELRQACRALLGDNLIHPLLTGNFIVDRGILFGRRLHFRPRVHGVFESELTRAGLLTEGDRPNVLRSGVTPRSAIRKLSIRDLLILRRRPAASMLKIDSGPGTMRSTAMHLRHLRGLQLAAVLVALTGCTGDNKIWIVVDVKMPNGKAAQMSFDDPSLADVDLQTCEQFLKNAVPILMQEIDGMPETKGSQFVSSRCVQSEESPTPHGL